MQLERTHLVLSVYYICPLVILSALDRNRYIYILCLNSVPTEYRSNVLYIREKRKGDRSAETAVKRNNKAYMSISLFYIVFV